MTVAAAEQTESRNQRWIIIGLTVAVAATRFLAVSRSMWRGEEALFALSLHGGPQTFPGSPLFVALGRLVHALAIHDDFRAFRTISLISAMLVFPVAVLLGRALRLKFTVAMSSALLLAFLPSVWAFGGTALPDVFSLVLVMTAAALLFSADSGGRWPRMRFIGGSLLFALAVVADLQNVLSVYPWVLAAARRIRSKRFGEVAAAAVLAGLIIATGYGVANGPAGSIAAYARGVAADGFANSGRPASLELFPRFAVDPFDAGKAATVLFIFALLGALFAERPEVDAVATFLPVLAFVLFTANVSDAARSAIGFAPLMTILAASGFERFSSRAALLVRLPKFGTAIEVVLALALTVRFATWFAPALSEVKKSDSPPVAALRWVRENLPPSTTLLVDRKIAPLAAYYAAEYRRQTVDGEAGVKRLPPTRNSWHVGEGESRDAVAAGFERPRARMSAVFGGENFEAFVRPFTRGIRYGDGWYPAESDGNSSWRWMGRRATLELEPIAAGGELRLVAVFPLDHEQPPQVIVTIDGRQREIFTPSSATVSRAYTIDPSPLPHQVAIELSNVVNPRRQNFSDDARDLGMQLRTIWWQP